MVRFACQHVAEAPCRSYGLELVLGMLARTRLKGNAVKLVGLVGTAAPEAATALVAAGVAEVSVATAIVANAAVQIV